MNYKIEQALRDRSSYINIFEALELEDNENIIIPKCYIPKIVKSDGITRATNPDNCFIHTTGRIRPRPDRSLLR